MKKNYLKSAAALLAAISLMSGAVPFEASAEETMSVVALGDSITTGYSKDGSLAAGYAEIVSDYYGAELLNLAQDGLTSAGLLEQLSDASVQEAIAGADVVLVTIGGNDILQLVLNNDYIDATKYEDMGQLISAMGQMSFLETAAMQSYMNKMMPEAIAACRANTIEIAAQLRSMTQAEIVFQTIYNPMDLDADDTHLATSGSMESLCANVNKYLEGIPDNSLFPLGNCVNGAIRDLTGVTVVDTFQTLYDHGYYYTDIKAVDVHPNSIGHIAIANTIIEALSLPETGKENGTKLRLAYTASGAEETLAGVSAELNNSILGKVLKNSFGDVDANGAVEIADATSALSIYAANGASVDPPVTGVNAQAADADQNGTVDIADATLVLGYYAAKGANIFDGTFPEYAAQNK